MSAECAGGGGEFWTGSAAKLFEEPAALDLVGHAQPKQLVRDGADGFHDLENSVLFPRNAGTLSIH
jgi:hypothetical protein